MANRAFTTLSLYSFNSTAQPYITNINNSNATDVSAIAVTTVFIASHDRGNIALQFASSDLLFRTNVYFSAKQLPYNVEG